MCPGHPGRVGRASAAEPGPNPGLGVKESALRHAATITGALVAGSVSGKAARVTGRLEGFAAYGDRVRVPDVVNERWVGHDLMTPLAKPSLPRRRRGVLEVYLHRTACLPRVEAVAERRRAGQHPPRCGDRVTDGLTVAQQACQELQDDLRLGVTTHRADDHVE